MSVRRILASVALAGLLPCASGCEMFPHWMQPEQMWKLNRTSPAPHEDGYFSVPAPPVPSEKPASPPFATTVERPGF